MKKFCKIPRGQVKRLAGQEWQFSPGPQKFFKKPV